jgi:2-keto-4-pentenoate hydratase/2-oxohepta-3-ene-1,7-dioic acid hydratase in catechol pathway
LRVASLSGRLALITDSGITDVASASDGHFAADPQLIYGRWAEFTQWARETPLAPSSKSFDLADLDSPVPTPSQVFAIGLNYDEHAAESGFDRPSAHPPVFTKFPTCITGPGGEVNLPPGGHTDWEVELVVVIGKRAEHVAARNGWDHVAGLTVGQDLSERQLQMAGPSPQFSLGKSYPRFGPIGPWVVTPDEFPDPDDLRLGCAINGEAVQDSRTSALIFPVPELIAKLSAVTPLLPGDLIFTGTPSGVGLGRSPQRWLQPGDVLTSFVEHIGEMHHTFH